MARQMAVAVALLAAVAQLQLAFAGVHETSPTNGVQYPGFTGIIPAACQAGVNESANGSPSSDLALSNGQVVKKVTGNTPEQVHITQGKDATEMYISWVTGNPSYTFCGPTDTDGEGNDQCFKGGKVAETVGTAVRYSTFSDLNHYQTATTAGTYPTSQFYTQYYGPQGDGLNYTSGQIHHVLLTGLKPETTYYYQVGDGKSFLKTAHNFKTLPAPGSKTGVKIAITADIGTTHATSEVLNRFTEGHKPDVVFLAGDHCYADNHDNDQRYWDAWFRLLEPSASHVPWQVSLGNHEEETQWNDCIVDALVNASACGNLTTAAQIKAVCGSPINSNSTICPCFNNTFRGEKGALNPDFVWNSGCNGKSAFVSATTRWAVPHSQSGSGSPHYYSYEFGLVHAIVLSSYNPYCGGDLPCAIYQPTLKVLPSGNSAQYEWLANDLQKIDREKTPWVLVYFHNPWYTTWGGFKTDDCVRQSLEPLLKQYNVDMYFSGHIHAYERSNPVFNFHVNEDICDPVQIVIGDAGNDETLNCALIDVGLENGKLNCDGGDLDTGVSEGYYFPCVSHTFQDEPEFCLKNDDRVNTTTYPASFYGCPDLGYCPNKQPIWSAYRAAAYGSGLLKIIDANTAEWTWDGFLRNGADAAGFTDHSPEIDTKETVVYKRCNTPTPFARK